MKKKKSEPIKATVSFSEEIPTYYDGMKRLMGLLEFIFNAATEKTINALEYRNEEEKEITRQNLLESNKRILDSLEVEYGKKIKKWIDEEMAKREAEEKNDI